MNEYERPALDQSQVPEPLRRYCLPYEALIERLRRVKSAFGLRRVLSTRTLEGEKHTFAELLDAEVEKVVLFFISRKGEVSRAVLDIRASQLHADNSVEVMEGLLRSYRQVAQDLLALLLFIDFNVTALRRLLRRHDRHFDMNMTRLYFDSRLSGGSSFSKLLQLYHQDGLLALISTLRRGFEEAHCERALESRHNRAFFGPSLGFGDRRTSLPPLRPGRLSSTTSHSELVSSLFRRSAPRRAKNKSSSLLADYDRLERKEVVAAPVLERSLSEEEPLLKRIDELALKLMDERHSLGEFLTARSEMALEMTERDMARPDDSDLDEDEESLPSKQPPSRLSSELLFVLAHTFMFMCNLFVVAPSSSLLAQLLGQSAAISGIIIGMSPLAAFASAYAYSAWTNSSFRLPLQCCTLCLIAGNLLYGLSLQCDSVAFAFTGRVLTGLGSSRVICRRFIVDHVPLRERTDASRNFITAGALGLAFGPLLASFISRANVSFILRVADSPLIRFETANAPGWIMFFAWTTFQLLFLVGFVDPLVSSRKLLL